MFIKYLKQKSYGAKCIGTHRGKQFTYDHVVKEVFNRFCSIIQGEIWAVLKAGSEQLSKKDVPGTGPIKPVLSNFKHSLSVDAAREQGLSA